MRDGRRLDRSCELARRQSMARRSDDRALRNPALLDREGAAVSDRTVFFEVATLISPVAEPFAVIRIDTEKRIEGGVEGYVESLHWSRQAAQDIADALTERLSGSLS
jgi:hypothetical protein